MEWRQYVDRDGDTRFVSEDPAPKKLIDDDGHTYYIVREKISAIYEIKPRVFYGRELGTQAKDRNWTVFVVDGESIKVSIHIDNAHNWLTSWED